MKIFSDDKTDAILATSFATPLSLLMIIWKRPVPYDDHLQEVGPFGGSFARGVSLWMIIYKSQNPL